jgi:hypothetical protein
MTTPAKNELAGRAPKWWAAACLNWAVTLLLAGSMALPATAHADAPIALQGVVSDRNTGAPIPNAAVLTDPRNAPVAITDGNGYYSLTSTQINGQDSGTLYFQASGYYVAVATYLITGPAQILEITLQPGGAVIEGTVREAGTLAGIVGATLNFRFACNAGVDGQCSMLATGPSTNTVAGGHYSIDSSQLLESGLAGLLLTYDSVSGAGHATRTDNGLAIPLADPLPLERDFTLLSNQGMAFQDVTARSGINFVGRSFGVSWGDFNGDGWPDLYTGNHKTLGSLWVNNRDGTFSNIFPSHWTNPSTPDKHGAAWGDFDNDGDQDIMELSGAGEGTGSSPNLLMVVRDGTVTNEAVARGVEYPLGRGRTPLWLDWNNDGLLDLFISNLSRPDGQAPSGLFLQSGGTFHPQPLAGLPPKLNSLFAQTSQLLGDGRRMLVVQSADIYPGAIFVVGADPALNLRTQLRMPSTSNVRDVAIEDFNGDLRPDLYLARLDGSASDSVLADSRTLKSSFNVSRTDRGVTFQCACDLAFTLGPQWGISPSKIFIGAAGTHPKTNTFTLSATDPATSGMTVYAPGAGSGMYVGYNALTQTWSVMVSSVNRLDFNVMITASADITAVNPVNLNPDTLPIADRLLLNTASGFIDAPAQAALTTKTACESVAAGDFDNDMDVDLYLVCRGQVTNLPNLLLENDGTGVFRVVPLAGGAEGSTAGRGDSVAVADFDNDGFLDLFVTNGNGEIPYTDGPYQLFRNVTANGNHWLELQLRGVQSNRDGVGARVIISAGGKSQLREQSGGVHRLSQNSQRLHFGLAGNTVVDTLTISWPSGLVQTINGVAADQILQVTEGVP